MNTAAFIISLDCEGKWGMADVIGPEHDSSLTTANLESAYTRLVGLFRQFEVPATFAFVMAFTLSDAEVKQFSHLFRDQEIGGRNWLHHFRRQTGTGNSEGWFVPKALDIVRQAQIHEVACHGFCHLPLAGSAVTKDTVRQELLSAQEVAASKGLKLKTFVYPRNLVGDIDLLTEFGYVGYRDALAPHAYKSAKLAALGEFNLFTRSQPHMEASQGLQPIPPGYFLNWRSGPRRLIPSNVTVSRWKHIIDHAVRTGGVAHVWLHPHNLITGPGTFEMFQDIVRYAAQQRDAGKIAILTQQQYCEHQSLTT